MTQTEFLALDDGAKWAFVENTIAQLDAKDTALDAQRTASDAVLAQTKADAEAAALATKQIADEAIGALKAEMTSLSATLTDVERENDELRAARNAAEAALSAREAGQTQLAQRAKDTILSGKAGLQDAMSALVIAEQKLNAINSEIETALKPAAEKAKAETEAKIAALKQQLEEAQAQLT